jgi:hypothetical protein
MRITFAFLAFSTIIACRGEPTPAAGLASTPVLASDASAVETPAPATPVQSFGAALGNQPAVALTAVLEQPDTFANKTVLVDGLVRKSCTSKGCWMEIAPVAGAAQQGCRVTFKNYGFFVPLDAAGAAARVEGVVAVSTVPKNEVEHLEAEGASFATKFPDGSAREVRIVANGVELKRGG